MWDHRHLALSAVEEGSGIGTVQSIEILTVCDEVVIDASLAVVLCEVGVGVTDGEIWSGQRVKVLLLYTLCSRTAFCFDHTLVSTASSAPTASTGWSRTH